MFKALPLAALFAASAAQGAQAAPPPSATAGAAGVTLRSDRVELPTGDRVFPGGPEADAINGNCVACHSAGMVLTQPALSRATWQAEVAKMIKVYKAPVDDADVPAIVEYLATRPGVR